MMSYLARIILILLLFTTPTKAVEPSEILPEAALETRARAISKELRCLVCQNQSIDDSDAEVAKDLRKIVRERLLAGDDDAAIRSYLVARFGHYVLLEPPMQNSTWALWAGPFFILLLGSAIALTTFRRARTIEINDFEPLSEDDQKRISEFRSKQ